MFCIGNIKVRVRKKGGLDKRDQQRRARLRRRKLLRRSQKLRERNLRELIFSK